MWQRLLEGRLLEEVWRVIKDEFLVVVITIKAK